MAIRAPYLYVAAAYRGLVVVDVSDPARPREIAGGVIASSTCPFLLPVFQVKATESHLYTLFGFGGGRYYTSSDMGVAVYDRSNPVQIVEVGAYQFCQGPFCLGTDVAGSGVRVFASGFGGGFAVVQVGSFALPTHGAFRILLPSAASWCKLANQ